ncbi:MAG TPA: IS1634 family transposase [Dehalococcoidia bacterium]|nr:IS1634 family transposase [Dehalococcoidia bacterium]
MYTRVIKARNKDGSIRYYLQLVRAYRQDGKVRQELVCSIGRLDEIKGDGGLDRLIASLARHSERCWIDAEAEGVDRWDKVYGPVLVFRRLWEDLWLARGLGKVQEETWVDFPLEEAAFAMVLHRLLDPGSKLATYRWLDTVYRPEFEALELQHLYRALDYLVRGKEEIEKALFLRNRDLFSLSVDLVLFDTTLVHFEGHGPQGLATMARPGNYPDCVKVLVGLVMTADGFPVAHHVFPGNTADIRAFQKALADLKQRFPLRRAIIAADRGVVSEGVMEELATQKVSYILGMPLRKNREVRDLVLSRAGRYHEVADNLDTKEVWVGGHRYVVCHNPDAEERDRKRREEIVERARRDLEKKGPQTFVMPRGLKRYVELSGGELSVKEEVVREEARYDGKWVLRTNTDLPAGEVAQAYKGLWRIERAFRELKSGLEIRPVYVRTEDHVRGHIMVCFLALVLEATFQHLLKDHDTSASYGEVLDDLRQLRAVRFEARGKAWLRRTELPGRSHVAFQTVGLRPPSRVQPLS